MSGGLEHLVMLIIIIFTFKISHSQGFTSPLLKQPHMTSHEDDLDMSKNMHSSLKTVEMTITSNPRNSDIEQHIDKHKPSLCLQCFFLLKVRIVNGVQFGRLSQLSHGL